jgi:hypothetical protein
MKTVFARALVALVPLAVVVALPASAFASSNTLHAHSVAKKDTRKKGGKHHGHKTGAKPSSARTAAAKAP